MFAVRIETVDRTAICRLHGEVDAATAAEVREALVAVSAYRRVVLDFSGVPFIDSAGLGCLIAGARRVHAANGDIVLSSARRAVNRLLLTVGMDRVMPMTDTLDEALTLLDSAAGVKSDPLRSAPPHVRVPPAAPVGHEAGRRRAASERLGPPRGLRWRRPPARGLDLESGRRAVGGPGPSKTRSRGVTCSDDPGRRL